jgi:CPA1 family monovalent cation:H+ antiporter
METQVQGFDFPTLGLILAVASLVAMLTRRWGVPYSVGLVAAGMALALLPLGIAYKLTPTLVYEVLLPPLIFEAAIQIPWKPFRRELPLLLALVTLGVVLAAGIVAAGMHYLIGWSWLGAAFFGVLLAATDPVSVIAMFKAVRVPRRLHLLIEAESLLNDGVAAVGFAVLMAIAAGAQPSIASVAQLLTVSVLGGIVAGVAVALPIVWLAGATTDRLVEVTLTTLVAYGSFLLAEHFHFSGVLATLTAGLIVGNYGFMGAISDDGHRSVINFWEYVAFLVNSLIFILIGAREAEQTFVPVLGAAGVAAVLSVVGRAVAIYPIAGLFGRTSRSIPLPYMHVLVWGGLRGALALALALALPDIADRDAIITGAFAVVAVSIVVQGLTISPLMRRLGLIGDERG